MLVHGRNCVWKELRELGSSAGREVPKNYSKKAKRDVYSCVHCKKTAAYQFGRGKILVRACNDNGALHWLCASTVWAGT